MDLARCDTGSSVVQTSDKSLRLKYIRRLKDERLGLAMIVASLAVIAVLVGLLFGYLQRTQTTDLRRHGVDLVRLLAGMPYDQLAPAGAVQGGLYVLKANQSNTNFAYAIVTGAQGEVLTEVTASGFLIPQTLLSETVSNWQGERTYSVSEYDRDLLEFYAPMVGADGSLVNLRLGFFRPAFGPSLQQLPFFAILALVVFMLTPLFYFMLQREIRPLRDSSEEINSMMSDGSFGTAQIEPTGELGELMKRFSQFTEIAKERITSLESERTQLETSHKLLAYGRDRIQAALHSLPDAVMTMNEDGKITFANRKVETLLGVRAETIIDKPTAEWCTDPDVQRFLSQYETKHTGPAFDATTVLFEPSLAPDNKLSMRAYPLFSPREAGEIYGNLIVFRDVSEEALEEEGREEFIARLAHELKTPLNTLNLYSEALLGPDGRDESMRIEACNVIRDEIERLSSLVGNMLSINQVETRSLNLDRQRIRLRDLVEDVFNHLSKGGRAAELEFELDLPRELSPVAVDKELLRIALNNLLSNAIKYSEPGGKVTLSAQETDQFIEIHVIDTGLGIAPEEQDRIFEKFYRSENVDARERGGHGLGLPLARQIVELHRGQLSVESKPGEGTDFTIRLGKETGLVRQAI